MGFKAAMEAPYYHIATTTDVLRIRDGGGSVVRVTPIPSGYGTENDGFEMILAGDSELKTLVTALKFAVKVLEDQINEVDD